MDLHEVASPEWMEADQGGSVAIELPEPDEDYAYAAARLFSWWPVVNTRGATYEPDDFDETLLSTLIGKQANLEHDKAKVIGSIISYAVSPEGVDVGIRIDRDQAQLHDFDLNDMRAGNYFSHVSVELTKQVDGSHFYAFDNGYNVQRKIPVATGRRMGIRRTTSRDPYTLAGMRVAEKIKPARFTGVGLVPVPADKTAELYHVRAADGEEEIRIDPLDDFIELYSEDFDVLSAEHEEADGKKALTPGSNYADPGFKGVKKYPLDTPGHVRSAAKFFGIASYRAKYTPAQRAHIDAKIAAAKKKHGIGDAETASTGELHMSAEALEQLQGKVTELEAAVASLTAEKETASADATTAKTRVGELEAKVTELETELASANEKIATYEKEKAAAEEASKLDQIMAKLNEIHPIADDEKEALRERASHFCDEHGQIQPVPPNELVLERTVKALEAKIAAGSDEAASAASDAAKAAEAAAVAKAAEEAAAAAAAVAAAAAAKESEQASEFTTEEDALQKIVPSVMTLGANGKRTEYTPGKYI